MFSWKLIPIWNDLNEPPSHQCLSQQMRECVNKSLVTSMIHIVPAKQEIDSSACMIEYDGLFIKVYISLLFL